jgi:hypothetical protein
MAAWRNTEPKWPISMFIMCRILATKPTPLSQQMTAEVFSKRPTVRVSGDSVIQGRPCTINILGDINTILAKDTFCNQYYLHAVTRLNAH